MVFVVPITTAGALPPLLRRQAHHQPLAGNRSESRWVTTLREGESSAYHVSKVGREALRSTRHTKTWWRWKNISALRWVSEDTVCSLCLGTGSVLTIHYISSHEASTSQQHKSWLGGVTPFFKFFLFRKMFSPKWICALVGPTRSSLCQGCKTFEFSALLVLQ